MRRKILIASTLAVLPIILYSCESFWIYKPQMKDLLRRRDKAIQRINKAETLQVREKEFDQEIQELRARAAKLEAAIPKEPMLEQYMNSLRSLLPAQIVSFQSTDELLGNLVHRTRIELLLSSPVPDLRIRLSGMERFTFVGISKERGPVTEVLLFIYSLPAREPTQDKGPCYGMTQQWAGLWPHSMKVKLLREDLKDYCSRLARLGSADTKVNQLEGYRDDIMMRSHVLEELRSIEPVTDAE